LIRIARLHLVHQALHVSPEVARLAEFSVIEKPVMIADFVDFQVRGFGYFPERWRSAVNEFSAELDRRRTVSFGEGENAPADPVSRFQHDYFTPGATEIASCRQSSSACTND
jgi:hypothetical protein